MGKIYDDWGRLVKAVIHRERLMEIAMCSSREPSSIDEESSRFSIDPSLLSEQSDDDLESEIAYSSIDGGSARYNFSSISMSFEQSFNSEKAFPVYHDETCQGGSASFGHKDRTQSEHDANKLLSLQKMLKPEFGHTGVEFEIDFLQATNKVVERKLGRSKADIYDLQQTNNELHASHKRIEKELEQTKIENCNLQQYNDELCASIFARKIEIHYLHTSINEVIEKEVERRKAESLKELERSIDESNKWESYYKKMYRDYEKQLDQRKSENHDLKRTITELQKLTEVATKTKRFDIQQGKGKPEKQFERSKSGNLKLQTKWEIFYLNKRNNYKKRLDEKKSEIHDLRATILNLRKMNEVTATKTKSFDIQQQKRMSEIHHLHGINNELHKVNKVTQEERERYKITLCVVMFLVLVTLAKLIM